MGELHMKSMPQQDSESFYQVPNHEVIGSRIAK